MIRTKCFALLCVKDRKGGSYLMERTRRGSARDRA